MATNSTISWTTHTANFWWGCVKVSALCDHCYAETFDKRIGGSHWGADGRRRFIRDVWGKLDTWNTEAMRTGARPRVFVMSMGDFFEQLPEGHPDKEQMEAARVKAMTSIEEKWTGLDFLVLTKRISNVAKMVPPPWLDQWPRHVRLGISVGTQKDADRDIPRLIQLPAPNFLSMEPLLEAVTLRPPWLKRLEWIITGGESGHHARRSDPAWFQSLAVQCRGAEIPFHFKQTGNVLAKEWGCRSKAGGDNQEWPAVLQVQEFPSPLAVDACRCAGA